MNQEPLTLYKLIVLYLLNKVSFPLTMAQVSDLILEKEYTSYLTLQQVINELAQAGLSRTTSPGWAASIAWRIASHIISLRCTGMCGDKSSAKRGPASPMV